MKENHYLTVGKYKGEWDFGVSGQIYDLSYGEMRQLREMTIVAIGQMEAMWARASDERNPTSESLDSKTP